jgi:hypothetical protein
VKGIPAMRCPHCNSRALIRTSREVSGTTREITYQCQSMECGHVWVSAITAMRTLTLPSSPNPKVRIPLSARARALLGRDEIFDLKAGQQAVLPIND